MAKTWDKRLGKHLDHQHGILDFVGLVAGANVSLNQIGNSQLEISTLSSVPSGGLTGQVLKKASATSYDLVWATSSGGSGGVTDHGELDGLADDDHTQYYNQARGDVRYAQLSHTHSASSITAGQFADARISESSVTQHEAALTITESQISDLGAYLTAVNWGSIGGMIGNQTDLVNLVATKADLVHTHPASSITSGQFADARISESSVTQHEAALSITESQISDFGSYANAVHTHAISDVTGLQTALDGKASTSHTHAASSLLGVLPVSLGGTGATNPSDARENLGLTVGTDIQAYSLVLDNTTASFTTADETKLDGIEALADVTDTSNVTAALVNAELAQVTPANDDLVLVFDTSNGGALTVVQADSLGGSGGLTQAQVLARGLGC